MKKKLFGFCAAICFLLSMACPAFASAAILPFNEADIPFDTMVTDNADLLTDAEEKELAAKAWDLTRTYNCAVYIVTLPSLEGMEAWEVTEYLWTEYHMGYGEDQSGVMLMLSMEYRDYDIAAHGYGNVAFTDYGKEVMAERFLPELGDDNWYAGLSIYLDCCGEFLELAAEGTPFDVGSDSDPLFEAGISLVASLVIAFIVTVRLEAQMKTAKMQKAAQAYIDQQGLVLSVQRDHYTHTTRSERYDPPKKSDGGTTVNDDGFSHSSGKF